MQTVKIQGKDYVEVKERIIYLSEKYPMEYSIVTKVRFYAAEKMWVVKAILAVNGQIYTGHAQEIIGDGYINKTSALENAETSAVGRACAMAGIGVIGSIASADEIVKSQNRHAYLDVKEAAKKTDTNNGKDSEKYLKLTFIAELKKHGLDGEFMAKVKDYQTEKFNYWNTAIDKIAALEAIVKELKTLRGDTD